MARPQKKGLEYFPLDVNFYGDIKVRKLMRNNGGGKAAFVYITLLCKIYESGYYMVWDDDMSFMLSDITGFEEGMVRETVKSCMKFGLLDQELYNQHHILTSKSIQARYLSAVKRRVKGKSLPYVYPELLEELTNMSAETTNNNELLLTETEFLHTETPLLSTESTQKESKVKDNSSLRSEYPSSTSTPTTRVRDGDEIETMFSDAVSSPEDSVDVALAVEELKKDRAWLLEVQQNNGMAAWNIVQWLDMFVNECKCRGKEEHHGLGDVKRHFLDWLKKKGGQGKNSGKQGGGSGGPDRAELTKRFNKLAAELCKSVSAEEAARAYTQMRFGSYDAVSRILLIEVATNEVYELLENKYIKPFSVAVCKYFGKVTLKYRLKNQENNNE